LWLQLAKPHGLNEAGSLSHQFNVGITFQERRIAPRTIPLSSGLIRWDEKAGLRWDAIRSQRFDARSSTVAAKRKKIFNEKKLTIGMDLGDQFTFPDWQMVAVAYSESHHDDLEQNLTIIAREGSPETVRFCGPEISVLSTQLSPTLECCAARLVLITLSHWRSFGSE
jgi:hypothetical protein